MIYGPGRTVFVAGWPYYIWYLRLVSPVKSMLGILNYNLYPVGDINLAFRLRFSAYSWMNFDVLWQVVTLCLDS